MGLMEKWHALGLTDAVKSGIIGLLGVIIGAIIAGIFTLGAIFITLRFQPVPEVTGRYHLIARQISEGQERLYKIDTRTGQVWFLDSKTLLTRKISKEILKIGKLPRIFPKVQICIPLCLLIGENCQGNMIPRVSYTVMDAKNDLEQRFI